jgi:tetratricopeptide (TPR) repeat protein
MVWLWLALFAGDFDSAFRAGVVALNENRLAVAEAQLETASRLEPGDSRVWLALAQTYWKLHKTELAREAAVKSESQAASDVVLHGLAVFYTEAGEAGKADELLQAAIRHNAYSETYYFELAQLRLKRQDFAAALAAIDAGRKNFDKSAQLELAAGVADYGLRRFPEAIDGFLRTIQLDAGAEQAYVFLGRMTDQAEDRLPRIVQAFAEFARRRPENPMSSFLYGKALAATDDPRTAEEYLKKSIAANGQFWEAHYELGLVFERTGRMAEAAREMHRATELNPDDAASHYRLARLYDRLGKPADAAAERAAHAKVVAAGQSMAGIK